MDIMVKEMLQGLVCICVPILLMFVRQIGNKVVEQLQEKTNNETAKRYMEEIWSAIETAVKATNQTYVDILKYDNAFDEVAQKEAKERAKEKFWKVLSDGAKSYLLMAYNDFNVFIDQALEKAVADAKIEKSGTVLVSEGILVDEVPVEAST
ncbi:hypothetical protein [Anaerotignum sp.]